MMPIWFSDKVTFQSRGGSPSSVSSPGQREQEKESGHADQGQRGERGY
jgi:hypothetical protein